MSMTADERKAWAHERLTTYLRDVEVSEFFVALDDQRTDLEGQIESLNDAVIELEKTVESERDRLDDRIDALREEVDERLEGDVA